MVSEFFLAFFFLLFFFGIIAFTTSTSHSRSLRSSLASAMSYRMDNGMGYNGVSRWELRLATTKFYGVLDDA